VTDEEYAAQSPDEWLSRWAGWELPEFQFERSGATEQYRARMLADWSWSESLVFRPLPVCVVTGI
jgi:hypothetical protein